MSKLYYAIRDLIQRVELAVATLGSMIQTVVLLKQTLERIEKVLRLRMPGLVFLSVVREEAEMLVFKLTLPPKAAPDVVRRDVTVQVGSAEAVLKSIEGADLEVLEVGEFSGSDNDVVVGSLVDIDDAGNASPSREFSFVLTDTIAPAQPGEVAMVVLREEADPAPAPSPEPTPEPAPSPEPAPEPPPAE